jgi:hypothetical protein
MMSAMTAIAPDDVLGVRRADWRYLLPDPALGRVAYPAPRDPELLAALERVAERVERAPAAELDGFDVIVLTGGGRTALEAAASTAPAGAWIYAELAGPAAAACARRLRRRGLEDVAAYWLWPDATRCKEIVPLEPTSLRHALSRRDPGARLRLRAALAAVLVRTGLFRFAASSAAVIARVPA